MIENTNPNKGDVVVFSTSNGFYEGKIVKVYDDKYIKMRYWLFGIIPFYAIDRIDRMLAHKVKNKTL